MGDHRREVARKFGPARVEALLDVHGMGLALGEDDRLAESVATGHLVSALHHRGKHLVDGVSVEKVLVHLGGVHFIGWTIIAPVDRVPAILLGFAELVVAGTLA